MNHVSEDIGGNENQMKAERKASSVVGVSLPTKIEADCLRYMQILAEQGQGVKEVLVSWSLFSCELKFQSSVETDK